MSEKIIIAIDGPAGSGKSTTAKLLAQRLGYNYIDTGAMYRAVTFLALKNNITDKPSEVVALLKKTDISLKFDNGITRVYVNNEEITNEIRTYEVNSSVSEISKIPAVRSLLVEKQKEMGKNGAVVMEGRDIGTVVFPNAHVKIFLTATLDERAVRRLKDFEALGKNVSYEETKENLQKRDKIDSTRETSPLTKADDAIEVDSSELTIEEEIDLMMKIVKQIAEQKGVAI